MHHIEGEHNAPSKMAAHTIKNEETPVNNAELTPLNPLNAIFLTGVHLVAIWGFIMSIFWGGQLRTFLFTYFCGILTLFGATAGAHRLWSHRSYKAKAPLRFMLALFFTMSGQSKLMHWVRDHRIHHRYSDTNADPHNAKRGFFYSQLGWLMHRRHPACIEQIKKLDLSDMYADPVVMFFQRNYWPVFIVFSWMIPVTIPVHFFGESLAVSASLNLFRMILFLNYAGFINSFAHRYGYRPYSRFIGPTENTFGSFLTLGEGWHNYHHVFPWDYRASEIKHPLMNITTVLLDAAAKMGWVYDMKHPSEELVDRVAKRYGDGTYRGYLPEVDETGSIRTVHEKFYNVQNDTNVK